MNTHYHIIIVGSGVAGLSAAEAVRKQDAQCSLLFIGKEAYLPYYRTRLSKYIHTDLREEDIRIHPFSWFDERKIEIYNSHTVTVLRPSEHSLQLQSGQILTYERLILALGSKSNIPSIPGVDYSGVFALRDLEDVQAIRWAVRNSRKVIVAGGGLLGLELAWAVRDMGPEVTVVEYFPWLLPKQVGKDGSKVIENILLEHGITLHLGQSVQKIAGKHGVEKVVLQSGQELPCDTLLFSVGVVPNTTLAVNAGIAAERGILVDNRMEASMKGIYAAGDAAQYEGRVWGLWTVAQAQGKTAGLNAAGGSALYEQILPSPVLRIGKTSIFSSGDVSDQPDFTVLKEDNPSQHQYTRLNIRDGRLAGAVLIGNVGKGPRLKAAIQENRDIHELLDKGASIEEIIDNL